MQMKPYKSFLFIFAVLAALLAFPLFFPNGKITLPWMGLRVYSLSEFVKTTEVPQELPLLAQKQAEVSDTIKIEAGPKLKADSIIETVKPGVNSIKKEIPKQLVSSPSAGDKIKMVESEIIIPKQSEGKWEKLSNNLALAETKQKPLRILYYGDSQIENDHITSEFRKALQKRYGGAGRGLVPVESMYNSANNFVMTSSDNWETESVIKNRSRRLDLGLLCEAFRISHNETSKDSVTTSWVNIKSIKKGIDEGFSVLSIFYRASGNSSVSVQLDENIPVDKMLAGSSEIREIRFNLGKTPGKLDMHFSTDEKITVYGLNLESPSGIMVDNIALRGRAYPEFTRIDTSRLKQMANLLNPAFIIMQYGVNVVPNIRDDYTYYKNHLNRELAYLKEILPETPVLMVSVSDMAHKANGELESYPNLESVLKAQKEAALENGCAFWNLYESMGGKGSMIEWVGQQPPLGNKDYVHYTSLGAEKVGGLFARQFIKAMELEQLTASLVHEP